MPIGFRINHLCARLPLGPSHNKIGQTILMSDVNGMFHTRVVLEPCPTLPDIYILKLARELTDILNRDMEPQNWDTFNNKDIVFSVKYHDNIAFLFVSDKESDFQFGVVENVCGIDGHDLANLICRILNGKKVDNFKIFPDGGVEMQ